MIGGLYGETKLGKRSAHGYVTARHAAEHDTPAEGGDPHCLSVEKHGRMIMIGAEDTIWTRM